MSEYDDWDAELEDAQGDSGDIPELRKAYRKLQKQNKELLDQLTGMKTQVRERSVKDVLAAKGLPPKIAAFIPDSANTSEEVEAWISEYGDVFGVQVEDHAEAVSQEAPKQVDPALQALGRISQAQSTGQPYSGDPDQLAGLIAAARTPEELNHILFGTTEGPSAY
jgi:hypothetical protein